VGCLNLVIPMNPCKRLIILIIDGLRRDVFERAVREGRAPALARLMGGTDFARALSNPVLSVMPSVTFAAQASIVTGAHPGAHGVAGNELFDRQGTLSAGVPRYFGFDVGDTLAVDDAIEVFRSGLASRLLDAGAPTLYERAARHGRTSLVAHHMYARGADWIRPDLVALARFLKGAGPLGLAAHDYDRGMLEKALARLRAGARPDVLTLYFMGLDHHSHAHGPQAQDEYLCTFLDPQIAGLLDALAALDLLDGTLWAVASDHGQIAVAADDRHSLRIGFPFDREMGYLFDALGLDVHDYPGEDPDCNVVVAANGGSAHVYLHRGAGTRTPDTRWGEPPDFARDVLPVARAFHAANATGEYAPDLRDALALVLVRDTSGPEGWAAPYRVCRPDGTLLSVEEYLGWRPDLETVDAANRLRLMAGANSGDILLVSNYAEGYYFGAPHRGMHGGLHLEDSSAVQALALPGGSAQDADELRARVRAALAERCAREGMRAPSVADLAPCLSALVEWMR
jgi:hypothetical protein